MCVVLVTHVHTSRCPVVTLKTVPFAFQSLRPPLRSVLDGLRAAIALPLLAGVSPKSVGMQFHWRLVEERTRRVSLQSDEYSARSRCYSMHTVGEKRESSQSRKEHNARGVHPFVISNVLCTAARPRAALPSRDVQSFP